MQRTRVRRPGGLGRNTIAKLFGGIAAGLIRRICGWPAWRNPAEPWFPLRRRRSASADRGASRCATVRDFLRKFTKYALTEESASYGLSAVSSFVRKRCVR
jgi:hypothetical protein